MISDFLKIYLFTYTVLGDFLVFSNDIKKDIDDSYVATNEYVEYFFSSGKYLFLGLLVFVFCIISMKYIQQIKHEKNKNPFKDEE